MAFTSLLSSWNDSLDKKYNIQTIGLFDVERLNINIGVGTTKQICKKV